MNGPMNIPLLRGCFYGTLISLPVWAVIGFMAVNGTLAVVAAVTVKVACWVVPIAIAATLIARKGARQ